MSNTSPDAHADLRDAVGALCAQFPAEYQAKLNVLHEGVDTEKVFPDVQAELIIAGHRLRQGDPVVTYVARNLEPYRGFHSFMRSLALLGRLAATRPAQDIMPA